MQKKFNLKRILRCPDASSVVTPGFHYVINVKLDFTYTTIDEFLLYEILKLPLIPFIPL